ncbi:MAG: hypothetical protein JNL11_09405 [Bdellovibrionaceae bacterium]|nr:hypothetical protein [Pseudobdellovibrionaceae bacterium]
MKTCALILFLFFSLKAVSQIPNQLNLDDVQIKGESSSSKLLNLSTRKKNSISDRISIKSSLTSDILEHLPEGFTTDKSLLLKKKK